MVMLYVIYVVIGLSSFNIFLHTAGCYLLYDIYKSRYKTVQQVYLINLSVNEIIKNVFCLTINVIMVLFTCFPPVLDLKTLHLVLSWVSSINATGIYFSYFLSMFLLTLDRLLHINMGIRYPSIWTRSRAQKLLLFSILINCLVSAIFCGTLHTNNSVQAALKNNDTRRQMYVYIHTFFNTSYLIFAFFAYIIMFKTFAYSRRESRDVNQTSDDESKKRREKESFFRIYLNSRFYVSILLISSYLLFMVVPSLFRAFYHTFKSKHMNVDLHIYIDISLVLCDTADGFIYIFLNPTTRKCFYRKLGQLLGRSRGVSRQCSKFSSNMSQRYCSTSHRKQSLTNTKLVTSL